MKKKDYVKELKNRFGYFDDSNEKLTITDYRELLRELNKLNKESEERT